MFFVKPGSSYTITFPVQGSTGAAVTADSLAAVLWRNGALDNAVSVTTSAQNGYGTVAFTVPSGYVDGDYIEIRLQAIVSGVTGPWARVLLANVSPFAVDASGRVLLQPTQTGVTIPVVTTLTNYTAPDNAGIATAALAATSAAVNGAAIAGRLTDQRAANLDNLDATVSGIPAATAQAMAGAGSRIVTITVEGPGSVPLAGATVIAELNGLWQGEATTRYEDPDDETSNVLPAILQLDDSPAYQISIRRSNFLPLVDGLIVSGNTEKTYTMTPYPQPDTASPGMVRVLFSTVMFGGTPEEGVKVSFSRQSETPLRISGDFISIRSEEAETDADGHVWFDMVPSDATPEGGTTWDGYYQAKCPRYGFTDANPLRVRIPSTAVDPDGVIRPIVV